MDNDAMCCNDKIVPTGVFVLDMDAGMNQAVSAHPMWVAGVMISKQTMVPTPPPVRSPPVGVATEADLYSSAFFVDVNDGQPEAAVAAQHLAKNLAEPPTNVEVQAII